MGTSSSPAVRRSRAVEALRSADDAIGLLEPGAALFLVTRGQFSMLDMVLSVLRQTGPAHVSVWTWAIADYEVEAMAGLMVRQEIVGGRLIVDRSAEVRSAGTIDAWRERFGASQVRVCKNHAKIARVYNDRWRVLLRGSMNLNFNARFEQADITEGGPEFDLVARLEDELPVLSAKCSHAEADAASRLGRVFDASQLRMFDGVKVWAK